MGKFSDLSSSIAIITGATGGIGFQFALELARRGCGLVLVDIDEKRLYAAADIITADTEVMVLVLQLDLTTSNVTEVLEDYCNGWGINPDILINNAGIFSFSPVIDTSERKMETFISLHMRAVAMMSRWFAMRRASNGNGWILNMSSMSCWMPMPGLALYASTKAFIRVFTRSLHYEMRDYGVGVTVACPGGIATDLFGLPDNLKQLAMKLHVLDTPERFAKKAIDKMLRKKKQYINGWLNRLSIFFVGILPTPVRMMIKHRLLDQGITR
ncbi:MAG: SDR family NAD(P)-dependent oxidoreductase [Bacteroides sp.]|nr:SDR family NAD(P)-dependent oxidoreductase [Bacteroides sp.]